MPKALLGTAILAHLCVGASFLLNAASYRSGHSVLPDFGDGDNRGLFLHLGMPGKRSVQAWFGWRRAKDAYYSTSHSAPGLKFIEVPCHLAAQAKCIVRSKVLHHSRDAMVGATTHFARQASLGAARVGAISRETLKQDLRIHTAANSAKHTTLLSGRPARADIAEQSDSDFDVLPTAGGPSAALVWPSTTAFSPTVSGTSLTVRAPCHPTVEWDSPAASRGPTAATQTDNAGTCDASTQTCDVEQIQQPPPYDEPAAEVQFVTRLELDNMLESVANSIGGLTTSLQRAVSPERFQAEVDSRIEQPLAAVLERIRVLGDSAAAASAAVSLRLGTVERRLEVLAEELAARPAAVRSPVGPDPLKSEPFDLDDAPHYGREVFARLHGLTNERYNPRPVRIWDAPGGRDRVPVQLADSGEFIKVKPANLGVYHPAEQDICCRCGGLLNLFALPPCERNPTLTSTATASSSSVSSASPA